LVFDKKNLIQSIEIMEKAEKKGVKIHLPLDFVCADKLEG
jgi:hypothetical protein